MAHVRQQIRNAVVAAISGDGTTVEASRAYPESESEMPRYLVYTEAEAIDEGRSTSGGIMRILSVMVECVLMSTPATVDSDLDERAVYLETALNYSRLGGLVLKTVLQASKVTMEGEGDAVLGILSLTFDVTYRSLPTNSEVIT